jgi:PAS domain S-box-containing protein
MDKGENGYHEKLEELRHIAELILREDGDRPEVTATDIESLVHELQVHHVELQMQNEELARTESSLSELKNRYRELFDFAPIGYCVLDRGLRILEANNAAALILQKSKNNLLQTPLTLYLTPNSRITLSDHVKAMSALRVGIDVEVELQRREGPAAWARLHCKLLEGEDRPGGWVLATMVDITEKKEKELHLAESRREYSEIVENANSIIAKMDLQGRLIFINNYGLELFGFTCSQNSDFLFG